jgi:murein DD-endopeptidase MepM/ murein hydrolase activator NlpD
MAEFMFPFPDSALTGHFGKVRTINGKKTSPHRGTDWAAKRGTPIPAVSDGTVKLVQYSKVLGWVLVQTVYGKDRKTKYVGYCHMKIKPTLKVGAKLKMGQTIGLVDTEGYSTGPHLHATLSTTVKGVFYGTVLDLYKYLSENIEKPLASAVQPKKIEKPIKITTIVYACPHCKKELK